MKIFPTKILKSESDIKAIHECCVICLTNYVIKSKVIKISCGHEFHFDCLKQWFHKNSSCPKCRKDVSTAAI